MEMPVEIKLHTIKYKRESPPLCERLPLNMLAKLFNQYDLLRIYIAAYFDHSCIGSICK